MAGITVTVTDTTIRIVSQGDVSDGEWRAICADLGITASRLVSLDDYTTDGDRHEWRFTRATQLAEAADA